MSDTTQLLIDAGSGSAESEALLLEHVYGELRRLARAQLRRRSGGSMQATELVHEAYFRLFDGSRLQAGDRVHFLSLAARVMRQVLIDHFRRRAAEKRGGGWAHTAFDELRVSDDSGTTLLAVDAALEKLARRDARLGKVVEYRFFGGMKEEEIAAALSVSVRTVSNDWRRAKAWLFEELQADTGG